MQAILTKNGAFSQLTIETVVISGMDVTHMGHLGNASINEIHYISCEKFLCAHDGTHLQASNTLHTAGEMMIKLLMSCCSHAHVIRQQRAIVFPSEGSSEMC